MVSRLLLACLVAALLSGCATSNTPSSTLSTTADGTLSGSAPPSIPGTAPAAPAVHTVALHLTADGRLDDAPPAAGGVTVGFAPSGFAGEAPIATFTGAPVSRPVQVTQEVRATLWVEADLPMPSNQMFDLGLWVGSARATPLFAAAKLPAPAVAPGTPVRFDLRLPFGDLAPLVLAAGDSFV
ncbi:MAG TPA: hypothetical protein VHI93_08805, partial [Candidatus Thermoplasmatota archaeon]|nr:hypothetical protein [Candidatus Thermoplasmatota archaeon]